MARVLGFVRRTKPQVASFNVQQLLAACVVFLAEDGFARDSHVNLFSHQTELVKS